MCVAALSIPFFFSAMVLGVCIPVATLLIGNLITWRAPNAGSFGFSTAMFVVGVAWVFLNLLIGTCGLVAYFVLRHSANRALKKKLFNREWPHYAH